MLSPGTILQNRYRIVRELGHGGMGTVYEALDQRVNSIVALKETTAARDADTRRAFEREAALLANLRHQALPKVMDYFSEKDGDFLVMEFIPGYDLAELLELRGEPFPQSQVLRWAHDLLRVLEYLHGQNPPILHRDIKPSNLKLTKQGEIFLLDFGLAKGAAGQMPTLANSHSVRGYTPVYASLEQINGHGTDPRSDIYSLGVTLYHLLTGVAPIDAPARFYAVDEDLSDPLPSISKINPQVTENVAQVIHQAMAISRKQRPFGAAELRKALRNAAEEDERSSAEQEYARAESKLRQLEEQRRREEAEAVARVEAEHRLQEAETRKKVDDARRAGERPQLELERRHEQEEASHGAQPLTTMPAPTVAPASESTADASNTIPGPPPVRFTTGQFSGRETVHPELEPKSAVSFKQIMLIAAVAMVLVSIGAFLIVWVVNKGGDKTPNIANSPQPQSSQSSQPPRTPLGMVYVTGGTFTIGRNDADQGERPAHPVVVKPFFIDTYEVTNEDYQKFLNVTRRHAPATWKNGTFPDDAARKPVTGVTWDDAGEYARWAGKRLPTEEEWEFAARGTDGRRYPWGNEWQADAANANGARQALTDVGSSKGTSPFGAFDMVGNAWEWTSSSFRPYPGGRLPADLPSGDLKVIRGGSYESTREYATTTYRAGWPAHGAKTYDQTGFRCARDVQ